VDYELPGVNVMKTAYHLLEQVFGIIFLQFSAFAYVTEQVATLAEFHDEAHVLASLKRVVQLNDILVCTLFQNAHLLH